MRTILISFILLVSVHTAAQTAALDTTFDAGVIDTGFFTSIGIQSNGRIIAAGGSIGVPGPYMAVVGLMPDGSTDPAFTPFLLSSNESVMTMAIDAEDRIVIGGNFWMYGIDNEWYGIARLLADGGLDPDFEPSSGTDGAVYQVVIPTNGKILLCGDISEVNGESRSGIARLNTDGSLDETFAIGAGFSLEFSATPGVYSMAVDPDEHILVGGWFDTFDGEIIGPLVRLTPDGILDASFAPAVFGPVGDCEINDILLLPDGRIRVAGWFEEIDGQTQTGMAGLLQDGALDPAYIQGAAVEGVYGLMQDGDGILLIGYFENYLGIDRLNMARIDANGGLDPVFDVGNGFDGYVNRVVRQSDGKILVAGEFNSYNGVERINLLRLMPSEGFVDCNGVQNGPALSGTPCDDSDPNTINDQWSATCECIGTALIPDCEGTLGGPAQPGSPCDDGIFFTTDDSWTANCVCAGYDCAGAQGGNAYPGTPCDDGLAWTYNDTWNVDCACMGAGEVSVAELAAQVGTLLLSPNPVRDGTVHIRTGLPAGTTAQLEFFDPTGRSIWSQAVTIQDGAPISVDTAGLPSGIHVVRMSSDHGSSVALLVVQR